MQIILVRHGQTNENLARTYLGHTDASLNDHGREQIVGFSKRMKETLHECNHFYASDLIRCQESAAIIAKNLNWKAAPSLVPALRELNFGAWECLTYERIMADDPARVTEWIDNPFDIAPPNGETLIELGARFDAWFEQFTNQAEADAKILIVCHGGPIRWFISKWLLGDEKQFWHIEGVKHGYGLIVTYDKNQHQFSEVKYI